jgi:hypothetical protein
VLIRGGWRVGLRSASREDKRMKCPDWIALGGVIATLLVSVVAIFGEKIHSSLFQPELRVTLVDPHGVSTTETVTDNVGSQYQRPARYYLVVAQNTLKWPVAHDAQIQIKRLEAPDPSGRPTTVWTGEIPLGWEYAQVHPLLRTIGPPARADLAVVTQDKKSGRNELKLTPVITPNNLQGSYYAATHIWVTVTATASEVESPPLRVEISWDGQWDAGETEMAQHLVVRASS